MTGPKDFLSALFPDPTGALVVFCVPTELATWTRAGKWDDAISAAQRYAGFKRDVYFGTGLQRLEHIWGDEPPRDIKQDVDRRGGSRTVVQVPFLHADVDCESPGKPDAPHIDQAYEALRELPVQPSVVVRSGWGLQPYWLLREAIDTTTDVGYAEADKLMGGWQQYVRNAWTNRGWKLDSTGDLARVLRFPGTFNLKHGQRREVKVDVWEPDRRYNPSDFTEYLGSWVPRKKIEPAGDWQPLSETCAAKVCAFETGLAAEAMARGEERHKTLWDWGLQVHHAHVPFNVAVQQGQILTGIAKSMPRERDRRLRNDEVYGMLCDIYENQPGNPSGRAEAIIREHGTEKDKELCTPVLVLGGKPLTGTNAETGTTTGTATGTVPVTGGEAEWLTPSEVIHRQKDISFRLPTGIPTLDALSRGGIPLTRMPVLIGKPGSGKTGLAIQIGLHMQRACPEDAHLGLYMADEGLGAAIIRIAQSLGFERGELEAAKPDVLNEAAQALATLPRVWCMDPDSPGASIEAFLSGMLKRAGDAPKIMVIDSVQVVRCESAKDKEKRLTVAMVADISKKFGRKYRGVPILLSQANRSSYRSKRAADNSDPLSAGSESGNIEHMADIQINMDAEDDSDRASVIVSKSRVGRKRLTPFYLELDRERATFREVDEMEISREKAAEATEKATAKAWAHAKKILAMLKKNPGGLTSRRLREGTGLSGGALHEAMTLLEEQGRVSGEENPGRGGGTMWKLGSRVSEGGEDD